MIRALHVLRPDHDRLVGGDLVQLHATVAALRAEGVDADAVTRERAPEHADVVHIYNVQLPAQLVGDFRWARERYPAAKVVVSPIVWPLDVRSILRTRDRHLITRMLRRIAKSRLTWRQCRAVLSSAAAVFPNSVAELRRTAKYFRIRDASRWSAIPNGIWVEEWPVRRDPPAQRAELLASVGVDPEVEVLVGCVARLETLKNQRALVDAIVRLPGTGLLLIGPRSDARSGERRYADATLGRLHDALAGRGAWLGPLERSEIQRVLGALDVHVLPSFRETPGIANLEAAATGCEIVATREGSAEEYFDADAHYAEAHSPASIAAAIEQAVRSPRQPGLRARVEQFDWSRAGRLLAERYRELV